MLLIARRDLNRTFWCSRSVEQDKQKYCFQIEFWRDTQTHGYNLSLETNALAVALIAVNYFMSPREETQMRKKNVDQKRRKEENYFLKWKKVAKLNFR